MTDQPVASQEAPAIADTSELTIEEGRRMLDAALNETPAEGADDATADPELSVEGNAAPEKATGETQEQDPAEQPPIPLPRSWAKEQSEHWEALPRATQEYLIAQDSKASAAVRQAQNEAAEKLKGLTAKEQKAEEARQKYEAKLPEVMQGLTDQNNRQFADIKSMADLETLANEALRLSTTDPVAAGQIQAYLNAWQVHQHKMAAVKAELDQSNQRKATKEQTDWQDFIGQENAKARELIPELSDPKKGPELERRAAARLIEIGFKDEELNALAAGKQKLGVYDHRIQVLINDSLKLAELQQSKDQIQAKLAKLPQVQRPGVARPAGQQDAENIKALEDRLNKTGSEKDAWALYEAQMKAASRRAS